jgi:hypothetical protein
MHNITDIDRQEGVEQAWHGLTVIRPDLDLNNNWLRTWDVESRALFLDNGVQVPFAQLVATDNPDILIGYPYNPETFQPITNEKFLELAKDAISGTPHKLISVGSVRGRGRTFLTFQLKELETFESGGRTFDPFLNMGNGHDKSSVLWVNTSNICTVCDNTFSFNLSKIEHDQGFNLSQRHTRNAELVFPSMVKLIDSAVGVQHEFAQAFDSLSKIKTDEQEARQVYAGFIAAPDVERLSTRGRNIVNTMVESFRSGRGNKGESLSDLFQGVTDYYTHSGKNRARQFASSEFGSAAARKREFWGIVRDLDKLDQTAQRGKAVLI